MYPHGYINEQPMSNFDMSKAPGRTYKYYNGQPLFSFGFGLSLTKFEHNCTMKKKKLHSSAAVTQLPTLPATTNYSIVCAVKNLGALGGDEVLQVYHKATSIGSVDHPVPLRALIDFTRLHVEAGAETTADFTITPDRSLALVDKSGNRTLYAGTHEIIVSRGFLESEQAFSITVSGV